MGERVVPVRLSDGLVREIDRLIERGLYLNRSDFIRDAVRFYLGERYRTFPEDKRDKGRISSNKIRIGDGGESLARDIRMIIRSESE